MLLNNIVPPDLQESEYELFIHIREEVIDPSSFMQDGGMTELYSYLIANPKIDMIDMFLMVYIYECKHEHKEACQILGVGRTTIHNRLVKIKSVLSEYAKSKHLFNRSAIKQS